MVVRLRLLLRRVRSAAAAAALPRSGLDGGLSIQRGAASVAAANFAGKRPRPFSRFDLESEAAEEEVQASRYKLALPPDDDDVPQVVRLDKITYADVDDLWPPKGLIEVPQEPEPVKRPIWLDDQHTISVEDIGRYVELPRDDLLQLLPEGPCGELARDLTLVPSRSRPVGLMLRKVAIELMMSLSELRDAKNAKGEHRIRKAGYLLDGHRGVGKSQTLNVITMWARRNGWLVVLEPSASRYRREIADIKRSSNGVYIQNEFAQQFLEATSIANRSKFQEIPVDMSAYGSTVLDGEPTAEARRLYFPLIEKTVDQEVADEGLDETERLRRIAKYMRQVRMPSMVAPLSQPSTVWDIVEFGLDNVAYATQAVAELFVQLQRQTVHPILVVVDEWNECFAVSEYVSIRYDNTRFYGYIPAYHLTMPRMFHRWDGHKYRRGLKLCATSWTRYSRREYRPQLLGVKDSEIRTVRNFSQQEFANYVMYLRVMEILHNFPREDLEYFYMMTQGNGFQARKLLTTLY